MTTATVINAINQRMANTLRHFPLIEIKFNDELNFFGSARGENRRSVATTDEKIEVMKHGRNWLYILWNRSPVKVANQRSFKVAHTTDNPNVARTFFMKWLETQITYAFVSPSMDLLEAVEEWMMVAGYDEMGCCENDAFKVRLYEDKEDIDIPVHIDLFESSNFSYASGTNQGTVTSLDFQMSVRYPALIRKDLQGLVTSVEQQINFE